MSINNINKQILELINDYKTAIKYKDYKLAEKLKLEIDKISFLKLNKRGQERVKKLMSN